MQKFSNVGIGITGMGIVTAAGNGINAFTNALKNANSAIDKVSYTENPEFEVSIGAVLDKSFSVKAELDKYITEDKELVVKAKKLITKSSLSEQASIIAAVEAWCNAGLHKKVMDETRIALVVGGSNLTKKVSFEKYEDFLEEPQYLSPLYAMNFLDTNQVGLLSDLFQIRGEGFSVGGASASGNVAIIKAMQLLRLGLADVCMVVGALADLTPMELQGFMNAGALAGKEFAEQPKAACRPFDKMHEGFVYGQGCGCIIFETEESAKYRSVEPKAALLGGSMCLDGNHLTNPNKDGEAYIMQKALEDASVKMQDVGYLNTHGSSSTLGDNTELEAIKMVFGQHLSHMWLNSTKGITGHCLFAAGVIEAIATVIQMNKKFIHKNINLEHPVDSDMPLVVERMDDQEIKVSLSNSFGFSGINTCIVIGRISDYESWNRSN